MLAVRVAGYKLKPFVIWPSENPRAFEHMNKHTLPVCHGSKNT